jgi:hypothetical protein
MLTTSKICNKAGSSKIDDTSAQERSSPDRLTKSASRYASSQTLKTLDYLLPLSFLLALSKHSVPLFGCVQSDDHDYIKKFPREVKEKSKTKTKKIDDPFKMKAPGLLPRRLTIGRKILATHGEGTLRGSRTLA